MKVILEDRTIEVSIDILTQIPHFMAAKHFDANMQEYDLHGYTIKQFTVVLRYLTTGYFALYTNADIFDYLQIEVKPLKVDMKMTTETIYPGEPKYVIKDGYIELDNEVSYKFKVYVAGLDEYYDIYISGYCFMLYVDNYKFSYDLEKYFKHLGKASGYNIEGLYSDLYSKEIKIKYRYAQGYGWIKIIFLTFSSVIPN